MQEKDVSFPTHYPGILFVIKLVWFELPIILFFTENGYCLWRTLFLVQIQLFNRYILYVYFNIKLCAPSRT